MLGTIKMLFLISLVQIGFSVCIIQVFSFRITKIESAVLTVGLSVRHELYGNSAYSDGL